MKQVTRKLFVGAVLAVLMISAVGCHWHRRHYSDRYDRYHHYDRR